LFFLGDPVRKGRTEKIGKNQLDSPHREVGGGISGNLIFFLIFEELKKCNLTMSLFSLSSGSGENNFFLGFFFFKK
jgi:hypothetical protein